VNFSVSKSRALRATERQLEITDPSNCSPAGGTRLFGFLRGRNNCVACRNSRLDFAYTTAEIRQYYERISAVVVSFLEKYRRTSAVVVSFFRKKTLPRIEVRSFLK
jgi:hypothetical protein